MGEYGYYRVLGASGAKATGCFEELVRGHGAGGAPEMTVRSCSPAMLRWLCARAAGALDDVAVLLGGEASIDPGEGARAHLDAHASALEQGVHVTLSYTTLRPSNELAKSAGKARAEVVQELSVGFDSADHGAVELGYQISIDSAGESVSRDEKSRLANQAAARDHLMRAAAALGVAVSLDVELTSPGTWPLEEAVHVHSHDSSVDVSAGFDGAVIVLKPRAGLALSMFRRALDGLTPAPSLLRAWARGPLLASLDAIERSGAELSSVMFDAPVVVDSAFLGRLAGGALDGELAVEAGLSVATADGPIELLASLVLARNRAYVELSKKWGMTDPERLELQKALGRKLKLTVMA